MRILTQKSTLKEVQAHLIPGFNHSQLLRHQSVSPDISRKVSDTLTGHREGVTEMQSGPSVISLQVLAGRLSSDNASPSFSYTSLSTLVLCVEILATPDSP